MASNSRNGGYAKGKLTSRNKRLILFFLGVFLILGTGAGAGMHYTSQPQFCATCHEIRPNVLSWSESSHNEVSCLKCHANPGFIGYISRKMAGLGEVYLHITNQIPQPIEARYNVETCRYCHTGKLDFPNAKNITLKSGDLAPRIPHQQILNENTSCLVCHRNVGHGSMSD